MEILGRMNGDIRIGRMELKERRNRDIRRVSREILGEEILRY